MHLMARADAEREGDGELAAEVLLEVAQAAEDDPLAGGVARVELVEPNVEAALQQPVADAREVVGADPALLLRVDGIEQHAAGDGFAVRDAKAGHEFQLVRGPVAEVERAGAAILEGIAVGADVVQVHFRAAEDEPLHRLEVAQRETRGAVAEPGEEFRVLDDGDLERLGHAAEPVAVGEREQEVEVVQHGERRRKGADGVFAAEEVDAVFHADTRVVLPEHSRRHADLAQAAVDERGGETDGVHDRAASDDDDKGMAIHAAIEEQAHEALDVREVVLHRLAAGDDLRRAGEFQPRGVRREVSLHLLRELRHGGGDMRVDEDERAMAAVLVLPFERLDERGICGIEEAVREDDREIPAHVDLLLKGRRGHAGRAASIQRWVSRARSRKVAGGCANLSEDDHATS